MNESLADAPPQEPGSIAWLCNGMEYLDMNLICLFAKDHRAIITVVCLGPDNLTLDISLSKKEISTLEICQHVLTH